MDGETAIAFAGHQFEQLHPRSTCPEWLGRCSTVCYTKDKSHRFIVSFAVTPKVTNDAVAYFRALVDPATAEVTVLIDRNLDDFIGESLQGFLPLHGSPWTGG